MKNHLIIGIGGTGGKIIRAFRKAIYQEYRKDEPEGVHVSYLYIDSSSELMDLNDPSWKVLGHSVQLGQNSQLQITGTDLATVLDNIDNYPGIRPWIGDRKQWREILNTIVGEAMGGQKRRLGRFLLANQVDALTAQLRHQVNELESVSGTAATTFHVCCGLAGGTGSGSIVDVVSQIRNMGFRDRDTYRIILYTLLPDENPPQNWDTGNYHANGFSALKELNALSVGAYQPYDITGQKRDRLALKDPFNGCYVFTNRNENGMAVDVHRVMPEIVADFLFQKIVTVKDVENWPGQLRRMENAENGDGSPETAPGSGAPERSKRFLTFGIKRLAVPEEEILEYMTYSFTSQASLQLLYNNWQDGLGYQEEPRNVDFKEHVQQADVQTRWRLRDEQVVLSTGILEADIANKKWKPIPADWSDYITNLKLLIRDSVENKRWIDELERACQKRYAEGFRTLGVAKFYETKQRAKKEMAAEICRLVEADLFDEWRTGTRSMFEISRLLEDLIHVIDDRIQSVEQKRSQVENRETSAEEQVKNTKAEWANISFLGKAVFGKRDKLFDKQANNLQELYIARTLMQGWDFGKRLLDEVKEGLNDLKAQVDEAFSRLRRANDSFKTKIDSRCADTDSGNLQQHLIRFYQPDRVRQMTARFMADQSVQNNQTSGVRNFLVKKLGETPNFRAFNKNMSVMRLMDTLEAECETHVKRTHDVMIQTAHEKLLGVNIIERLKNQYGANFQELRSFIAELVGFAGNYVHFSKTELNKKGEGIPASPTCVNEFTAILPHAPEHSDFMELLKKALTESRKSKVNIIETDAHPNEIILISITNLFPLRFLSPLANLKEKYEQRIEDVGRDRAALEIYTEGQGTEWPPLFVETQVGGVERAIPYLLLAKGVGLLVERENQTTGLKLWSMVTKDEDGFDNEPIDLGKDYEDIVENIGVSQVNQVVTEVDRTLAAPEFQHQDRKKELIAFVASEMDMLKEERGLDDPLYKQFLNGAKTAAKRVKGEAR